MLDLTTLQKTINWLQARKAQLNDHEKGKLEMMNGLIAELQTKANDVKYMIEQNWTDGSTKGFIKEKETNIQTIYRCVNCGHRKKRLRKYFSQMHIDILTKIYKYCVNNGTHEIQTKDLNLTHSQYCNIASLQSYGFLYYQEKERKKTGKWGVAIKRIHDFLKGQWRVAQYTERDTDTKKQWTSSERILISEVKEKMPREDLTEYFYKYEYQPFEWGNDE